MHPRGNRRELRGVVTSHRMQKTIVVSIERTVLHSKYKKYLKRRTKVMAHDEKDECQVGDQVLIVESRPLSRLKRWRLKQILERAVRVDTEEERGEEARP